MTYIKDSLVKFECLDCGKQFLLSQHQADLFNENIMCPYCQSDNVEDIVILNDESILQGMGYASINVCVE